MYEKVNTFVSISLCALFFSCRLWQWHKERLSERSGGIVQGMSGSPIVQDGKLVGAVTHVLISDPARGYGVFIENMLNAA